MYRVVIDGEVIAVVISLIGVSIAVASLIYSQKNRDMDIWNRFMGNQAMLAITIVKFTKNLEQYLICKYGNNASKQLADVERDLDESMDSFATILEAVPPKHDAVKQLMLEINNRVQIIRSRSDSQDLKFENLFDAVAVMCLLDATLWGYARDSKLQDYSNSFVNNKIKQEAEALDACRIEQKINDLCQKNKAMEIVFELDDFKVTDHGDVIGEAWVAHINTLKTHRYLVRSDYLKQVYKGMEGKLFRR